MSNYSEFLEHCYLDWQQKSGKRKTLNDYADYLGVKRPLLSLWLNGTRKPGEKTVKRLALLLGLDIYDALGLDRPDKQFLYVEGNWEQLSEKTKDRIAEEVRRHITNKPPDE